METVNQTNNKLEQQQARAQNAITWMSFYKEVDSLGTDKLPEIAARYGLDASLAISKYQQRQEKKALRGQAPAAIPQPAPQSDSDKPAFQLVQFKPKVEPQIETERITSETPVVEQIFADPTRTSPTKKPLKLYDITDDPSNLMGGTFCEQISYLPISKEYIKGKYGGGSYIVRETQPDGKESLPVDSKGMPLAKLDIVMTREDQIRHAMIAETNKTKEAPVIKDASPAEKMMLDIAGTVVKNSLTPQIQVDPMAQLSQIITVMNQLRPPQTGLSEQDKLLNERLDKIQAQLGEAKEAVYKKEIEFLNQKLADKKINQSGAEVVKELVTKTITEMGIKGQDEEEVSWLTTAFRTAAKSEATVNKALGILQGVGFAILQALTKSPAPNGGTPAPESKALGAAPTPQTPQQPIEQPKTQQEQIEHYKNIDREQSEKDTIKLIKLIMNTPVPSAVQCEWILQGEAIPLIFPVEINEINQAVEKVYMAQAQDDEGQIKSACDLVRQAFGKFKEPLKNVFESENGKAFIEGLIKNYVLEE